jgi:hypothetical protein
LRGEIDVAQLGADAGHRVAELEQPVFAWK